MFFLHQPFAFVLKWTRFFNDVNFVVLVEKSCESFFSQLVQPSLLHLTRLLVISRHRSLSLFIAVNECIDFIKCRQLQYFVVFSLLVNKWSTSNKSPLKQIKDGHCVLRI